ncbi:hypothetical protein Ae717Ps2_6359c [Pseudonocardia sp. Ae717_Ps2]|nr:hypothetical protein Ae717Ps2_6359c [Pseudonocardia sp. Ae717_Ps2]
MLRTLKWGAEGMTWEQVAEAVDGQLGGRQAMQKRWTPTHGRDQADDDRGHATGCRTDVTPS